MKNLKKFFMLLFILGTVLCLTACGEDDDDHSKVEKGKSRKNEVSREELDNQAADEDFAEEVAHVFEICLAEVDIYDEVCDHIEADGSGSITIAYEEGDKLNELDGFPYLSETISDVYNSKKLRWDSDKYAGASLQIIISKYESGFAALEVAYKIVP